jgi:hypothetical protein
MGGAPSRGTPIANGFVPTALVRPPKYAIVTGALLAAMATKPRATASRT